MRYFILSGIALAAIILAFFGGLEVNQEKKQLIEQIEDASLQQRATFFQHYRNHIQNQLNNAACPGAAIIVVKDSSIWFEESFGLKELGRPDSIDNETVFRIGSLSKAFAAVLAGIMVEEGKLDWDTPLTDILPYFKLKTREQTEAVEVQHLLSHSIGFPRHIYTNQIEALKSPREVAEDFKYVYLQGNPGEYYAYQNAAFAMIEEVLDSVSGLSYQSLLEQKILGPAGMQDASTDIKGIKQHGNKAIPHKYNRKQEAWVQDSITPKYYNAISAGGINASISDMAAWIQVLFGNRPDVVSSDVLAEVYHPYINTSDKDLFFNKWQGVSSSHYAMGFRFLSYKDKPLLYHGGYVNEFRSEIALDPDRKLAVCALFNSACSYSNTLVPDFFEWLELYEQILQDL
ncbi:MAG: serine hydrolase domain-containing protein [Bacteroidia bacterium]|nr:serine hydrolase domain-containing protein [Bacteroidia bacterium]